MSLKELAAKWTGEKYIFPGDRVSIINRCRSCVFDDPETGKETLITHEITEELRITTAKIYEFKDEFGLREGLAGIIGNEGE
jgi:hypothetical protein